MQLSLSRNPYLICIVLGAVTAIVFSFWVIAYHAISGKTHDRVKKQQSIWLHKQPVSYSYTAYAGCMYTIISKVLVIDGNTFFENVAPEEDRLVIDKLFKAASKGLYEASSIEIKYHSEYGFPELIEVDWNKHVIDDECFYKIENFKLIE
ncbi:DUF6174 domain-containing protein [Pseudoalteromonas luteoviolacea]|uniref:Uncharacterized protein n=1 Tax=Pseudoalteromonas luteoviolacea (strain 2ta16) TaxID=1353533 RepID=V4HU23_PSEL2|nr:DUF6174 domain-containing protein [Pseudoalteromonas luteoviolacea]ESP91414.1 hypothetical protein PL2TA16_00213 [Pseudoalteromonas luteoviolacea 2ta16]KZN40061.1 hypothetical protein N483_17900 [Pseudoalteromonas luteoviolacea NCIMB 1944]